MLTVNLKTGQQLIFMDFYPCKAKDFNKKVADLTAKVEKYVNYINKGASDERTR